MPDFPFPRAFRVRNAPDFRRLREQGRSARGSNIILSCAARMDGGPSRIGIITGRKVGGAVLRNRVRRRIREIFRHAHPSLKPGLDFAVIARRGAPGAPFADLRAEWESLARRLGAYADQP